MFIFYTEKTAVPDHLMLIRDSLLTKDGGYVYVSHAADGVADDVVADDVVVDDGDYFGMDYVHDDVAERNRYDGRLVLPES
ncbi:MAG: hypothetical protein BGO44_06280 [Legionella sp. 39-23]|nr:MAG: hypothetical protein BGO44_06280 [Legionella sp. 39-23]